MFITYIITIPVTFHYLLTKDIYFQEKTKYIQQYLICFVVKVFYEFKVALIQFLNRKIIFSL